MLPFPCAVYSRSRSMDPYVLQHIGVRYVERPWCPSLAVEDLRRHRPDEGAQFMKRLDLAVFAAGDVAQSASAAELVDGTRKPRFLFHNSEFHRLAPTRQPSELADGFALAELPSWTVFYRRGRVHGVQAIPGGVMVFPKIWRDKDAADVGAVACRVIEACARAATWYTDEGGFYNEIRLTKKRQRVFYEEASGTEHVNQLQPAEASRGSEVPLDNVEPDAEEGQQEHAGLRDLPGQPGVGHAVLAQLVPPALPRHGHGLTPCRGLGAEAVGVQELVQ